MLVNKERFFIIALDQAVDLVGKRSALRLKMKKLERQRRQAVFTNCKFIAHANCFFSGIFPCNVMRWNDVKTFSCCCVGNFSEF